MRYEGVRGTKMSKRLREWRLSRARAARAEKPAAPPDPIEQFAKEVHDLDALRKTVEDAAAVSAGFWLSYLLSCSISDRGGRRYA
jgi:hypothetical protein